MHSSSIVHKISILLFIHCCLFISSSLSRVVIEQKKPKNDAVSAAVSQIIMDKYIEFKIQQPKSYHQNMAAIAVEAVSIAATASENNIFAKRSEDHDDDGHDNNDHNDHGDNHNHHLFGDNHSGAHNHHQNDETDIITFIVTFVIIVCIIGFFIILWVYYIPNDPIFHPHPLLHHDPHHRHHSLQQYHHQV